MGFQIDVMPLALSSFKFCLGLHSFLKCWIISFQVLQGYLEGKLLLWHCSMVSGEGGSNRVASFDQFFQWHRLFMVTVWAATIAGVVLVAIELGGWPYDQVDCPNLMMMVGWWRSW